MAKNIMLAFVSPVSAYYLSNPITYADIQGRPYTAIQTNESAIVYVERMLGAQSLSKIFLIASDFVKLNKVPENEFGNVTHLEFLRRRMLKEFPQLAEKFSVQDYSDESGALDKNILQTAEIADAVMKFASQCGEKVIVHADITGGFRYASMLMLSIIQLLRYRGIKIGEVLYSDPTSRIVYSVAEIQRMFTLITGADEFVKFGSAEALNEYFGDNPPPAANDLLAAMNRFDEAIKICRTSAIEDELKNLGQHIRTFREHPDKDLKSELFAKIIDTIEREYGKLIGGATERLEIIRWCMSKGFWQQAMTLCTEWLPDELVARKICTPKDSAVIRLCESKSRDKKRTWQQYFIIDYKIADKNSDVKECGNELRNILNRSAPSKICDAEIFAELKKFFREHAQAENFFTQCKYRVINFNAFKQRYPKLAAALQTIYDMRRADPAYKKNFYGFLDTIDFAKIPMFLSTMPEEKLFELFKIDRDQMQALKSTDNAANAWEARAKEYRTMFEQKIIRTALDVDAALKFLQGYYELRRDRNQINHADAKGTKTIAELKPQIENYLAALEQVPK